MHTQNLHALGGPLGSLEHILAPPGPSTQSVEELQRRTRLERGAKENAAVNGDQLRHPSLIPAFSRSYSVNAGSAMHGATSINALAPSGRPEFARGAYARPNFSAQRLYLRRRPVATGKNAPHSNPGDAENSHHVDDTHSRSIATVYRAKLTELLCATDACKHEPPNLSEPGDAEAYLAQMRTPQKTEQHDALVQLKHRLDVHRVAAKQERLPTMAAAKGEWGCRVVRLPDIETNAEVLKATWDARREAFGV